MRKLESVWHNFLRRMVKGGFKRQNAPKNKHDTSIPNEEINWAFKLSNEKIRHITKTSEIERFCIIQHMKYIAHVTRLGNGSLQKQFLYCKSDNPCGRWKKLSTTIGIDESQLRRMMMDKKEFKRLLDSVL